VAFFFAAFRFAFFFVVAASPCDDVFSSSAMAGESPDSVRGAGLMPAIRHPPRGAVNRGGS
jgi:hypothetical protein